MQLLGCLSLVISISTSWPGQYYAWGGEEEEALPGAHLRPGPHAAAEAPLDEGHAVIIIIVIIYIIIEEPAGKDREC